MTNTFNSNPYYNQTQVLSAALPANAADVTPNDSTDLSQYGTLYVGTGGDVKVDLVISGTVTYTNVADGSFLPILVKRVHSTGTTASDIVVQY